MKKSTILAGLLLLSICYGNAQQKFNALAKPASSFTINKYYYVRDSAHLDFNSKKDYIDAHEGMLATWPGLRIADPGSNTPAWNMAAFKFLDSSDSKNAPFTVNPSLWRQAKLNYIPGIFKVVDGMYQARGFGLANSTFIQGNNGWIVIDPLESSVTAKAAFDSLRSVLTSKGISHSTKISAVIFTHSHIDHYGGILGIKGYFLPGTVIYGPAGFLDHAISENTIAGNVMGRRATYMYGSLLLSDTVRMVDAGLGKRIASSESGILANNISISRGILHPDSLNIDGIPALFWSTPGAEAPSEMMFYFPGFRAICASEEVTHTMHNVYSLRGAKVRDALAWSKFIDSTLDRFGDVAQVIFASHHWPVWGSGSIKNLLVAQRDLYRYIHDQSMRMANQGNTPLVIAQKIKLPESLDTVWANRGYYGTLSHNSKSVYNYYLGWFDGNPANLNPIPPQEAGVKYVEFMGGAVATLNKAYNSYLNGEYRWAAMVLNHLVFAMPDNLNARFLLADVYEQLGYQAESAPWRNFYLTGAQELRFKRETALLSKNNVYPETEVMNTMPLDQYLDFMAIHLVPDLKTNYNFKFKVKFNNPTADTSTMIINLENNAIHYKILKRVPASVQYDATIYLPQDTMNVIITRGPVAGKAAMDSAVNKGIATIQGDAGKWYRFISMLEEFKFWFNIVAPEETTR
jgi:alkyl sulfatase BDS1-like metallo-beta-lactamase superfamily hydrolase